MSTLHTQTWRDFSDFPNEDIERRLSNHDMHTLRELECPQVTIVNIRCVHVLSGGMRRHLTPCGHWLVHSSC